MKLTKEVLSGATLLAFGLGSGILASGYVMGTVNRMGPGLFPTALSVVISVIGLVVLGKGILTYTSDEAMELPRLKPVLFIALALLAFGWTLPKFGLFPAIAVMTLIGRIPDDEGSWLESLGMVLALWALCYVVFIHLLQLRLPLVTY